MKIEFIADKLQISGPRSTDNSFVVKLETGEYNNDKMGDLLKLPPQTNLKITIETEND
jgi:hypothetical protein